jgi:hypothetical protein
MSIVTQEFLGSFVAPIVGSEGAVGVAGVHAGDPFSGTFSYDTSAAPLSSTSTTAKYPAISFTVTLPDGKELGANQVTIFVSTEDEDPSISVIGNVPHINAFMGILLRGPGGATGPVQSTTLPTSLDVTKFIFKNFTLCDRIDPIIAAIQEPPLPPLGSPFYLRGHLSAIHRVTCLSLLFGLLSTKYCVFRRQPT